MNLTDPEALLVYVAEDDPDDRIILSEAFRENGIELSSLRFALDGQELMEIIQQEIPSLLILDLNLPRKDGREVLRDLKSNPAYRKIPVVVLTTSNSQAEVEKCYDLGANSFVVKPDSYIELVNIVRCIKEFWMETAKISIPRKHIPERAL